MFFVRSGFMRPQGSLVVKALEWGAVSGKKGRGAVTGIQTQLKGETFINMGTR